MICPSCFDDKHIYLLGIPNKSLVYVAIWKGVQFAEYKIDRIQFLKSLCIVS